MTAAWYVVTHFEKRMHFGTIFQSALKFALCLPNLKNFMRYEGRSILLDIKTLNAL